MYLFVIICVFTCPPPSGNRIVSLQMTSNPVVADFLPFSVISKVVGVQDTTSVENFKNKVSIRLNDV